MGATLLAQGGEEYEWRRELQENLLQAPDVPVKTRKPAVTVAVAVAVAKTVRRLRPLQLLEVWRLGLSAWDRLVDENHSVVVEGSVPLNAGG